MPSYLYEVVDKDGNKKKEIVEAENEEALIEKLQGEGYFIVNFQETKEKAVSKSVQKRQKQKFDHDRCKIEDLLIFSRQLATMLEAGVTMLRSLDVILTQIQSKELCLAVSHAYDQIEQGFPLSSSLAKHPRIFNQFWVSLAEVGEASGTMPMVLNKLADHVEREAAFKSAIISAMVYPIILLFVCIGAVTFFALVVGPRFEDIFKSMHAELPVMTRTLLAVFHFIKSYIFYIVGGIVAFIMMVRGYISTPIGKEQYENFIFALPVFGDVTKLIIVERFSAQMAILIESGVPILYSLEITSKLVDNRTCGKIINKVREAVAEGKGIADALMTEPFFPLMAVQMIKVGEETGELGKMLKHVAAFYQSNVEAFMKRFGTIIEPFMLVFMASIIGVIVVSIFMPLFKLGQATQNQFHHAQ